MQFVSTGLAEQPIKQKGKQSMWKYLSWLQKNLVWSIPLAMLAGLMFGKVSDPAFLRSAILPLTFLMVYPMMVTMNFRDLLKPGGNKLQTVTLAINFLLMPAVGYGIGLLLFANQPMIRLALLLTALLPTSGMTISWTGFAKGNVPAAVKMTVIGLIAGSFLAPLYLKMLLSAVVEIPLMQVFIQIALIVFLPLLLGALTQSRLIKRFGEQEYNKRFKQKFPPFSTLGVLGIVFVSMALKAKSIISHPDMLPNLLIPLVLIYTLNFVISTLIGKILFTRNDAIALVYGTVMRNLSIALAIALGVFGEKGADAALLIALAYIVQVQSGAWYIKFTDRLFGEPGSSPADSDIPGSIINPAIKNAKNIIFCFGKDINDPGVLALRPRSIGVVELEKSFIITFLEAPNPMANSTMESWAKALKIAE